MRICLSLLFALSLVITASAQATSYATNPETKKFITEMVEKHGFKTGELRALFAETEYKQSIIDAITRPAESKPWYEYRPIFVTQKRIRQGVKFWKKHADLLERAEKEYGVPPAILVAILGVETRYGRHTGSYRVMDSLATLAFNYPARSKFFRGQLEQFLLMAREEGFDPLSLTGSYAGAMGQQPYVTVGGGRNCSTTRQCQIANDSSVISYNKIIADADITNLFFSAYIYGHDPTYSAGLAS